MFSMYDLTSFADRLEELQNRVGELEALRVRVDALEKELIAARGGQIDGDKLPLLPWMRARLTRGRWVVDRTPKLIRDGKLVDAKVVLAPDGKFVDIVPIEPMPSAVGQPVNDPLPPGPVEAREDPFARAWRDYSALQPPPTQE